MLDKNLKPENGFKPRPIIEGIITTLKDKDGLVKLPVSVDKGIIITLDTESNRFEKIVNGIYYPVTLMDALKIIDEEIIRIDLKIKKEVTNLHKRIDTEVITINKRIDREVNTLNNRIDDEVSDLNNRITLEVETLNNTIETLKENLTNKINELEQALLTKISEAMSTLRTEFDKKIADLKTDLENQILAATTYDRPQPAKVSIGTIEAGKTKFKGSVIDALDRLFYPPIKPTTKSFTLSFGDQENGALLQNNVLSYEFNKNDCKPEKVVFYRGNTIIGEVLCEEGKIRYSFTDTTDIVSSTTYKAEFVCEFDAEELKLTSTKTINYMNKAFWGPALETETIDSKFIMNLPSNTLTTSKTRTINTDLKDGNYFYYAIPTSFGTPAFYVGGFEGGFRKVTTLNFVNNYGYSESYDVWRSSNNNLGVTKIEIK